MKKWVLGLVALLWLLSPALASDDMRGGAILYVVGGASADKDTAIANNFDYGLFDWDSHNFWSSGANDFRDSVEAYNPDFQWLQYNSLTDNFVAGSDTVEHDTLAAIASRLEIDVEEGYLHYQDSTIVVWDTLSPEPGDTTWHSAGDRVYLYYKSNPNRRACNFSTEDARAIQIPTVMEYGLRGGTPGVDTPHGIWFDNAARDLLHFGLDFIMGGEVEEAGEVLGTAAFNDWHFNSNIKPFLLELQDSTDATIVINISNYWHTDYESQHSGKVIADGYFLEFQYGPIRNWGVNAPQTAFTRDSSVELTGAFTWQSALSVMKKSGGDSTITFEEAKLHNLAWYLTTRKDSTLFGWQNTNSLADTAWCGKNWLEAFRKADNELGTPTGDIYLLDSGTDPVGKAYKVWARDYDQGLAWVRARGNWNEEIGSNTAVTVTLNKAVRPMNPDGTPGDRTDNFEAENGSAGILLNDVPHVIPFPAEFNTLQEAVDYALPGDTILINSDEVFQPISVNNHLAICADTSSSPSIQTLSSAAACSISVAANDVLISGITFLGNPAGATQSVIVNNGVGTTLLDCSVTPDGQSVSAAIEGQYGLTIRNSILEADSWGVRSLTTQSESAPLGTTFYMEGCILEGCGIDFEDSLTTVIKKNVITNADTSLTSCPDTLLYNIIDATTTLCPITSTNYILADPLFCEGQEGTGDYTLRWDSPIVAANNSWGVQVLDKDVECAWGTLARTTTVSASDTVLVLEDAIVSIGVTLILSPGARIEFDDEDDSSGGYYSSLNELIINGTLLADAGGESAITFTREATSDWGGLVVDSTAVVDLDNIVIEYAETGIRHLEDLTSSVIENIEVRHATTGVSYDNCGGSISNSSIDSCTYGLLIQDVTNTLAVDSVDVTDCDYGITIQEDSDSLSVTGNTISGNSGGVSGIYLDISSGTPDITSNSVSGYSLGAGLLLASGTAVLEKNNIGSCKYGIDVATSTQTQLGDPSDSGSDNLVHNSGSIGIKVRSSGDLLAYNNKIYSNPKGVYFYNGSTGNLGDMSQDGLNSIYSNTTCVINNNSSGSIPAYGNWWGSCAAPSCTYGSVLTGSWKCYQPASSHAVPIVLVEDLPSAVLSVAPNPTGHLSSVKYRLAEPSNALRVEVFDVQGRLVRSITEYGLQAGTHEVIWDLRTDTGSRVRSGVYWMRVHTDGKLLDTKQIVVSSPSQEEE